MKKFLFGILISILSLILATSICLAFLHINDSLYISDVRRYDMPGYTGMSEDDILANYNAVMDYLTPFTDKEFTLPSLAFSENGAYHFYETKLIFEKVYLLGGISALLLLACAVMIKSKKISYSSLLVSSISTIALPSALLAAMAINFDSAFVLFHKIFFNNNMWIFDYRLDPIINILPQQFFMHCAFFIAGGWLLFAIVQLMAYFLIKHKTKK